MSKHPLTIAPDYVPSWGITEAIRELFQNVLDQETIDERNTKFFEYNPETKTLTLGNKCSVLEISSLLFGKTTKQNDTKTIGQNGEGYKIAALVLARENKEFTIYNYGKREVWTSRFVNSRLYDSKVLTFFVDKKSIWEKVPSNNLTMEIKGITQAEYDNIVGTNLHLQNTYETEGQILLEEQHKGKIFVHGLYVCNLENLEYGYNLKPEELQLDRDRRLVNDFNLYWVLGQIWGKTKNVELIINAVQENISDVRYLGEQIYWLPVEIQKQVGDALCELLEKENRGEQYIVVSNEEEHARVPKGVRSVLKSALQKKFIQYSPMYSEKPLEKTEHKLVKQLKKWKESNKENIDSLECIKLDDIINELNIVLT